MEIIGHDMDLIEQAVREDRKNHPMKYQFDVDQLCNGKKERFEMKLWWYPKLSWFNTDLDIAATSNPVSKLLALGGAAQLSISPREDNVFFNSLTKEM